jgi:hypothetical protein
MTISVTQISNTQTFGAWLSTTNRLADIVTQNTVTSDATTGGSVTTGNSFVNGHFGSNFLYVANTLSGGNVSSNGVLRIQANVAVFTGSSNLLVVTANSSTSALTINTNTTISGSVDIGNTSSNVSISGGALTINGTNVNTAITGNAATAYTNATSFATTVAGTAYTNAVSYANTISSTAYTNATSFATTAAGTAYTNATSFATSAAGTAYTNAIAYSANATNISNGTLSADRLSGTYNITANNATNFNGQAASYYANASNLSTGTLPSGRLSGTYTINITGTASGNYNAVQNINVFNGTNTGYGYYLSDSYIQASGQTVQFVRVYTYNPVPPSPDPVNVQCVFEGTPILMSDGTTVEIQSLSPGDVIYTGYKSVPVLGIHKTKLGSRRAYSINGIFCTADHPVYCKDRKWKTMDVGAVLNTPISVDVINGKQIISKYDIIGDSIDLLRSGDTLMSINGCDIIAKIHNISSPEDTAVYTIILENDSTFVAGNYLHAALKKVTYTDGEFR